MDMIALENKSSGRFLQVPLLKEKDKVDISYRIYDFDVTIVAAKATTIEKMSTQGTQYLNSGGSLSKEKSLSLDTIFKVDTNISKVSDKKDVKNKDNLRSVKYVTGPLGKKLSKPKKKKLGPCDSCGVNFVHGSD